MAVTSISNPNASNNGADTRAIALKVFSGELLAAFERKALVRKTLMSKSISHGKSSQFPAFGRAASAYHVRGANLLASAEGPLTTINTVERLINVDELLTSATFVTDLDEMLSAFDSRSVFVTQLAESIARTVDFNCIRQIVRAARTNRANDATFMPVTSGTAFDGEFISATGFTAAVTTANGALMLTSLHQAASKLDANEVPREGRFAAMSPDHYWSLIENREILNQDYGNGANGVQYKGAVAVAGGFQLIESTQLPTTSNTLVGATVGEVEDYSGDFRGLQALAYHSSAAGVLNRADISLEIERKVEYQGTLLLAKTLLGVGRLRPEASVEISTDATQATLSPTT